MPLGVVVLVCTCQPVPKELLVILNLDVMDLEPDAGNVDGVAMRGETPVGVINVSADVPNALDHSWRINRGFVEIAITVIALVDAREQSFVPIDARWTKLLGDDCIDSLNHAVVVGRAHSFDKMLTIVAQTDGIGP
jgi:hypothetical protein